MGTVGRKAAVTERERSVVLKVKGRAVAVVSLNPTMRELFRVPKSISMKEPVII